MRFVDPRTELGMARKERGRARHHSLEQHNSGRKVRRRDDSSRSVRDRAADRRIVLLPPGRADHDSDAASRQHGHVLHDGIRCREIHRDVDAVPAARFRTVVSVGMMRIDLADDLAAEFRREAFDHLSHLSVADQENPHRHFSKNAPCKRVIASATSASSSTNVNVRRDDAWDTSRSGILSSATMARANTRGSSCSRSPTTETIAIFGSVVTSANAFSSHTISASFRVSSTVTDTLTSDVVTTSTAVLNRSNTSNRRLRKPCAPNMRVDVMSTTVTSRLQARAARYPSR